MSINRDMRTYGLQQLVKSKTSTGAQSKTWKPAGTIQAAVYKTNELLATQSVYYRESTHSAITTRQGLVAGRYRLTRDGRIYSITGVTEERFTTLFLKEVDMSDG